MIRVNCLLLLIRTTAYSLISGPPCLSVFGIEYFIFFNKSIQLCERIRFLYFLNSQITAFYAQFFRQEESRRSLAEIHHYRI